LFANGHDDLRPRGIVDLRSWDRTLKPPTPDAGSHRIWGVSSRQSRESVSGPWRSWSGRRWGSTSKSRRQSTLVHQPDGYRIELIERG